MVATAMVAGGMALASAAPALAAPPGPTPDTPSCHGQLIATNNLAGAPGVDHPVGVGEVVHIVNANGGDITVKDLQAYVTAACA